MDRFSAAVVAAAGGGELLQHEVTSLLEALTGGDRAALDALFPVAYDELRRLARRQLASEQPRQTLGSVALVNEAYLKLVDQDDVRLQNRAHFVPNRSCYGPSARRSPRHRPERPGITHSSCAGTEPWVPGLHDAIGERNRQN